MSDFTDRLDQLMEKRQLKRIHLSNDTGIPEGTIRQWYRGSMPNIELAAKIAKYFNVTTDWLIMGDQTGEEVKVHFLESEEELIEVYRKLTEKQKETIKNLLDSMS